MTQNSDGVPTLQLYELKTNPGWGEIVIYNPNRELLRITKDGDVLADNLESASEAGKVFVESIRFNLRGLLDRITELEATLADATRDETCPICEGKQMGAGEFCIAHCRDGKVRWTSANVLRAVKPCMDADARKRSEFEAHIAAESDRMREVVELPPEIAAHVLSLGRVEWGQTPPHDANGHGEHVAQSVRKTAENFRQEGDQHMHGLWLEGTDTVLCHTGTSPNAPKTTQALVGAWNWLVNQAAAIRAQETHNG